MTPEEIRADLRSMFSFLKDNGPEAFQEFVDTLEPEYQEFVYEMFEAFVEFNVETMTQDELAVFEKELVIRLGAKVQ